MLFLPPVTSRIRYKPLLIFYHKEERYATISLDANPCLFILLLELPLLALFGQSLALIVLFLSPVTSRIRYKPLYCYFTTKQVGSQQFL